MNKAIVAIVCNVRVLSIRCRSSVKLWSINKVKMNGGGRISIVNMAALKPLSSCNQPSMKKWLISKASGINIPNRIRITRMEYFNSSRSNWMPYPMTIRINGIVRLPTRLIVENMPSKRRACKRSLENPSRFKDIPERIAMITGDVMNILNNFFISALPSRFLDRSAT